LLKTTLPDVQPADVPSNPIPGTAGKTNQTAQNPTEEEDDPEIAKLIQFKESSS